MTPDYLGTPPNGYTKPLDAAKNLSDLTDAKAARDNLSVASKDDLGLAQTPIGTIIAFYGTVAPTGYIPCMGQTISYLAFPDLVKLLAPGKTSATVPDLRGSFLRGWDNGRGLDPNRVIGSEQLPQNQKHGHAVTMTAGGAHGHAGTASTAGGHTHTGSTAYAGDHAHSYNMINYTGGSGAGGGPAFQNTGATTSTNGGHTHAMSLNSAGDHTHTVSISSGGDHTHTITIMDDGDGEARPRNIAIFYCIKAFNGAISQFAIDVGVMAGLVSTAVQQPEFLLVRNRVTAVEQDVADLKPRLVTIEGDVANLKTRTSKNESDIGNLSQRTGALETRAFNLEADTTAIKQRLTTAETNIGSLTTRATNLETRVTNNENRLTATERVANAAAPKSSFASSLSATGFQKIEGGFTMQWGSIRLNPEQQATVTFPTAFSQACFSVQLTVNGDDANGANQADYAVVINKGTATFTMRSEPNVVTNVGEIRTMWGAGVAGNDVLPCYGQTITRAQYGQLVDFLAGPNAQSAQIPDLRGEFLRGWDNGRGADPGRQIGSWQDSDNRSHAHNGYTDAQGNHAHNGWTDAQGAHQHGTAIGENGTVGRYGNVGDISNNGFGTGRSDFDNNEFLTSVAGHHAHNVGIDAQGLHSHNVGTYASGINEARPRNVAVNYCIRVQRHWKSATTYSWMAIGV